MKLADVDLNLLVYLDFLLREASVSKAAARAGITQSAMSRALGRLREHLDDKLLVSVGRRMELTEHAKGLRRPLQSVLSQIGTQIFGAGEFDPRTSRREFSIAGPDFIDALVAGPLIEHLGKAAPGVNLNFLGMTPAVDGAILDGQLDLLIGFAPRNSGSVHARPLLSDSFACVARQGHPAFRDGSISLEDYVSFPHVLVAPGGRPGSHVDRALAELDAARRIAVRVRSFLLAPHFLSNTDYLLTIPGKIARGLCSLHGLDTAELPIAVPSFRLSLVWHARNQHDRGHVWLRGALVDIGSRLESDVDAAL